MLDLMYACGNCDRCEDMSSSVCTDEVGESEVKDPSMY